MVTDWSSARAESGMCRDVIDLDRRAGPGAGGSGGTVRVTFLGAEDQSVTIECPKDEYLLDAAIEQGLELPFSCRGGICGACVGRVASGSVDQSDVADLSFTLEDEQVEAGMALLCMSRPLEDATIETQSDWGYSLGVKEWQGASGYLQGKEVDPLSNEADASGWPSPACQRTAA
eukprot:CAMPEP_0119130278 /NCGR_PEP_ID=MMETSP1310-20130426/7678_1 /TAXON_ID=464262 /ORGANISM="Genus nov. species nov., Strain RCC2339" /LENGTH=174 /DNA_ID=CAMNT_0007120771 /DNA_START=1 /DNA_END=522 /DNA_ORIENTATION=+